MTPQKERLDEAALEREVEQLFAVEPAADFQARIRARVASAPVASAPFLFWQWWVVRGALVAVAGAVLLMLLVRTAREPLSTDPTQVARTSPPATVTTPKTAPSQAARDVRAETPVATAERRRVLAATAGGVEPDVVVAATAAPVARDPFSDVQVSASEVKALRQIEALMAGKQLKEDDAPRVAVRDDMTDLVIAPIAIEPIQLVSIKGDAE